MAAYAAKSSMNADARDAWINVQKKTFTRWANNHLKKRGLEITDLFGDACDGVAFCNLLEVIGGESIKSVTGQKVSHFFVSWISRIAAD